MLYRKATISKQFFPLGGMRLSISPWSLNSDPYNKEQDWFKKAWRILADKGLVSYENDQQRVQVAVRTIALALMYLDFCANAFDVLNDEPPVDDWADYLNVTPEMLLPTYNNLNQTNYSIEDVQEEMDFSWREMIVTVANNARDEVFDALLNGFGDDMNEFFDSLLSIYPCDYDHSLDVFSWFSEKMYQFRPYF